MNNTKRRFYYHYSKATNRIRLVVQGDSESCIDEEVIALHVFTSTWSEMNNSHPHFVMAGVCESVRIDNGVAVVS